MAAVSSEWFCLVVCLLLCSSEALENITAEVGQNVTLTCRVPNNKTITAVEWITPELKKEYVLLYRDGHVDPDNQHPSYKNRVDLQDREMKDGDVSLILKNVTKEDRGTYECRVSQRETNRRKRSNLKTEPIITIDLEVHLPGGEAGGRKGGGDKVKITAASVGGGLIVAMAAVGCFIYNRQKKKKKSERRPPGEEARDMQLDLMNSS